MPVCMHIINKYNKKDPVFVLNCVAQRNAISQIPFDKCHPELTLSLKPECRSPDQQPTGGQVQLLQSQPIEKL